MIQTPKNTFYILNATKDAAEVLTLAFSERSFKDVESITVLSKLFDNDIESINELDNSINALKDSFSSGYKEKSEFNPLYFPTSTEVLEEVFEPTETSGAFKFSGMNGNPFAIISKDINDENDELLIHSLVCYRQFELPSYEEIISSHKSFLMN